MSQTKRVIIEFCGVPGGGKSTTAAALAACYPHEVHVVHVPFRPVWRELWHAAQFALFSPRVFVTSGWFFLRYAESGFRRYTIHLWIRACAKHAIARGRSELVVVVDEGLLHLVATLANRPLPEEVVGRYVRTVRSSGCVGIAHSGGFHRFRDGRRVVHPRVRRGAAYLADWQQRVVHNTTTLHRVLTRSCDCVWDIPPEGTPEESARALMQFLLHRDGATK